MIPSLKPLARLTGVELVMLVTHDGIPLAAMGPAVPRTSEAAGRLGIADALAAESVHCLDSLSETLAAIPWNGLNRIVLRGAHGSLVLERSQRAVLVVLISSGPPSGVRSAMASILDQVDSCWARPSETASSRVA